MDCLRQHATGVRVTAQPSEGSTTFYLEEGLPSPGAEVAVDQALGGIVNLPPVPIRLTGTLEATGETVFEHVVLARPDRLFQLILTPSER